ncbi:MAG TPA: MFS transporter [Terriglobales bacterium]|nr:MFS transporter [Terriglobales bacterium]
MAESGVMEKAAGKEIPAETATEGDAEHTTAQGSPRSSAQANQPHPHHPHLSGKLLAMMTLATCFAVANTYYNQPMLGLFIRDFGATPREVALMPFLCQIGYALGLFFLAPLGDRIERKTLILLTLLGLSIALAGAALAPSLVWLGLACLLIGILTTVVQQIVPLAVHLAEPAQRGKVVGTVTGGLLVGILLARTVSGYVSDHWHWRAMFAMASGMMLALTALMAIVLPRVAPVTRDHYGRILTSLFGFFLRYRRLRLAGLCQGMMFACFSAFWANLALELRLPPYNLGATYAGLMGLIGAVGALAAPIAGRIADRHGPETVVTLSTVLVFASFLLFILMQGSMPALVVGVVLMDLGVQSALVSNQAGIHALDSGARSRINTVFMTTMFCCGALGSMLGGSAFEAWGWTGTCAIGLGAAVIGFLLSLVNHKARHA